MTLQKCRLLYIIIIIIKKNILMGHTEKST